MLRVKGVRHTGQISIWLAQSLYIDIVCNTTFTSQLTVEKEMYRRLAKTDHCDCTSQSLRLTISRKIWEEFVAFKK